MGSFSEKIPYVLNKRSKNVSKKPIGFLEIDANAMENFMGTVFDVKTFFHTGKRLDLGKFVKIKMFLFRWK